MDAVNWALSNPGWYVLLGWGVGFTIVFGLLFVGGNPGEMLSGGRWTIIGLVAWNFIWPVMLILFVLLVIFAVATEEF